MKLHIFDAGSGDGLLLESNGGTRILVDGGKNTRTWDKNLEGKLAKLHKDGHRLDAIYVSHIDSDHIGGVLRLLTNLLDWKVFEAHADDTVAKPTAKRPPEVAEIWHNAFRDLITKNRGRIEELLAATAPDLLASSVPDVMAAGQEMADIATSVPEALRVSQIAGLGPLGIDLNRQASNKLIMVEETPSFTRGDLNFEVIGPTDKNLRELRKGWDNWLRDDKNRAKARAIREEIHRRLEEFANGTDRPDPLNLSDWNGVPGMDGVTVPNTVSLMFLVTETGGPTLLLTGDSHHDLILDNLETLGKLDANGAIHVDVLKVPHHGSANNVDENFVKHVTADHYVFCGNGGHGNPKPSVLDLYYRSRRGTASQRAVTAEAQAQPQRPFTFWFSTTSPNVSGEVSSKKFAKLEEHVDGLVAKGEGLTARFNKGSSVVLSL